jgi:hypothetical protein
MHWGCRLLLLALALPSCAMAQDDSAALPGTEDLPATTSAWSWFGDVLLRADRIPDIPRAVEPDFDRVFGRARLGVLYDPIPQLQFGAAIRLAAADHGNDKDRFYNLNERSNAAGLDQAFLRWRPDENTTLQVGKTSLPLELTPLVWDEDLRPIGASLSHGFAVGTFDRLDLTAGYFAGDLPYGDESRIGALQVAWRWHAGAPVGASVILSYLDFSDLRRLTAQGLARSNRHTGDTLLSDYRLLDLQLVARWTPGSWPIEARLDLLRNVGADSQRDGARFSLIAGDRRQPGGWEFGLAQQRFQRDAAMAAFNSDEWWFHSAARGTMPWIGYGLNATWNLRLAAFHERGDTATAHTNRFLLDINARW